MWDDVWTDDCCASEAIQEKKSIKVKEIQSDICCNIRQSQTIADLQEYPFNKNSLSCTHEALSKMFMLENEYSEKGDLELWHSFLNIDCLELYTVLRTLIFNASTL
jgi:hypothetical protein